jgi:hypothetical protein
VATTVSPPPSDADSPRARFARGEYAWETLGPGAAPVAVLYSRPLDLGRDWTAAELRTLKRDWFREAQANDELRYLRDLAGGLGSAVRTANGQGRVWEGRTAGLRGQRVRVLTTPGPDGQPRLRVVVGQQTVCDTGRGLFVPGKWLDTTRGALPQLERAREQHEHDQATALRRELGLDRRPPGQALADGLGWAY